MVKRILGYVLMVVGLFLLLLTFESFSQFIGVPDSINSSALIIAGVVLLLLGIIMVKFSGAGRSHRGGSEVPIYHGKRVVGYRRP